MMACDEKVVDKFLHGDDAPDGVVQASLEEVKAKVTERGGGDVVIVKMEKHDDNDDNDYFVYVCPDDLSEAAPTPIVLSSVQARAGTASVADLQREKINTITAMLRAKCGAIGHCFEAFPILIEEVKKQGRKVRESLLDEITAKQGEYNMKRRPIMMKLMMGKFGSIDDFNPYNVELTKWNAVVFNFLKEVFAGGVAAPKPSGGGGGGGGNTPEHVPKPGPGDDKELKRLQALVEKMKAENQSLTKQLEEAKSQNSQLSSLMSGKDKEIEELNKKLKPAPIRMPDPKLVGTELEFKPVKKSRDGKEETVFLVIRGYFKYHYIAKELVAAEKLDPTKPAKLLIESYETHCHTDEEEETRVALEYYVPKGEDFFICRGKVSQ